MIPKQDIVRPRTPEDLVREYNLRRESQPNGRNGRDGRDGRDGITPHIGENGNWFIGNKDTGIKAKGSRVSFLPTITSGHKIGTIMIDGVKTDLFAPASSGEGGASLPPIILSADSTVEDCLNAYDAFAQSGRQVLWIEANETCFPAAITAEDARFVKTSTKEIVILTVKNDVVEVSYQPIGSGEYVIEVEVTTAENGIFIGELTEAQSAAIAENPYNAVFHLKAYGEEYRVPFALAGEGQFLFGLSGVLGEDGQSIAFSGILIIAFPVAKLFISIAKAWDLALQEYVDQRFDDIAFETDETLTLANGVLSVNRASEVEADNTLPITSAAVAATVGNIAAILKTI